VFAAKTAFATAAQATVSLKETIMKAVQLFTMSALMLGGVALIGCDKKGETTTTTTTTSTPTVPTTESAKTAAENATDKAKDAAKEAGDKIESGAKKAENAADNALNNLKK
jgi:hypothetical protein